jgi:hypothetical protein
LAQKMSLIDDPSEASLENPFQGAAPAPIVFLCPHSPIWRHGSWGQESLLFPLFLTLFHQ